MNLQHPTRKIDSIQAIRAFAAIFVMLFHGTQIIHKKVGYLFLSNIFVAGFSGVDVFFVLSGFIILYTSSNSKINRAEFIKKRFVRIYPIYWIVTTLLLFSYLISPSVDKSFIDDLSVIFGSFALFPQKQYIVGVAWTLTYEVIFYLMFAFTYYKKPKILFYTLTIWVCLILVFQLFNIKSGFFPIDALAQPVIINFALGCLLANIYMLYPYNKYSHWIFFLGMILFIASWFVYFQCSETSNFSWGITRVLMFGIPASFIILGLLYLPISVPKAVVFLGDASYSIYLVHGTVLSGLVKIVIKLNLKEYFGNFTGAIVLFICTLIICCFFYITVEKKTLSFFNKLIK